ncbi:MAG: glycoside hydrolase family 32 protein [Terracidiphilus sp.]
MPAPLDRRAFLAALSCSAAASLLGTPALAQSGAAPGIAHDPLRPECHLLPPHNWMNDPNGPIWWKASYHLFYQLNPNAAVWGDMHWGHAISSDMVHWRHLPIALAPTPGGDSAGCFSGSAVVFRGVPTFIYTGVENAPHDQATIRDGSNKLRETQMLATAEDDDLLHWKKLAAPVITAPPPGMQVTGFRDPCPWQEADGWYLGVGSGERGVGGCVLLYFSRDLREWQYLHKLAEGKPSGKQGANPVDTGEMWECPDFFQLDGRSCLFYSTEGKVIWSTGDYDARAHRFTSKIDGVLDRGAYYAPKSFLTPDGRRILWGWIRETRPEAEYAAAGWAGVMSLPRQLNASQEGQIEIWPSLEVDRLRSGPEQRVTVDLNTPYQLKLDALRHEFIATTGISAGSVTVRLLNNGAPIWELVVDVRGKTVRCGDITFPLPPSPWPRPLLRLLLDASVIESFIGGREAFTSRVYKIQPGQTYLEIAVKGASSVALSHWPLAAISANRLTT